MKTTGNSRIVSWVAFAIAAVSAVCGISASAAVHVMKGEAGDNVSLDWSSADNYEDGAPSAGDIVVLPQVRKSFYLTYSADDHASFDLVASLKIVFPKSGSQLVITVPDGADLPFECAFNSLETKEEHGTSMGYVVKRGGGTLRLKSNGAFSMESGAVHDYYMRFKVEAGKLLFPQGQTGYAGVRNTVYEMILSEGAETWLTDNGTTRFLLLSGSGMVTNTSSTARLFQVSSDNSATQFSGTLGGGIQLGVSGTLNLTGVNNSIASGSYPYSGGTLGVAKIGNKGEPSSPGLYEYFYGRYGKQNTIVYLGEGETTDKTVQWYNSEPFVFDAGANGGITFVGRFDAGDTTLASNRRLVLSGSNTVNECVIAGRFTEVTVGDVDYSTFITKRGSGIWHFKDHPQRANKGVVAAEEGTLRFDSLEEIGRHSALGYSTQLYADEFAAKTTPVDYAFALGGEGEGVGTFEYAGTNGYWCSTRPFAVKGNGRIVNNGKHPIRHLGFKSYGAAAKTLTLGGTSTATNEIADITDADAGTVSVVKEGAGTWKISGDLTFRGKLDVKGGRLIVKKTVDSRYTWFKWVVRENYGSGSSALQVEEFGLYDSSGNRLNTCLSVATNYTELAEGQVAFATHYNYQFLTRPTYVEDLSNLTDDNYNQTFDYGMAVVFKNSAGNNARPVDSDPSTYIPIVMRLPTDVTAEVASFDWVNVYGSNASSGNMATAARKCTLYGSVDGLHWEELKTIDDAPIGNDSWIWAYAGRTHKTGHDTAHTDGCPLTSGRSTRTYSTLENVASVSVANGAVLEVDGGTTVSGLEIDATSGGSLKGIALAETGTLVVKNAPRGKSLVLPGDYSEVGGLDNLANWTLVVNGTETTRYSVMVDGDKITLFAPGAILLVK